MPESVACSENETVSKLKKASEDVIDFLTTLGTLDLASLSKEAEDRRVKLREELIDILSSCGGLVNGVEVNGGSVEDVALDDDVGAEDYEVPTATNTLKPKAVETDRLSTASMEKKPSSKSSISHSKSTEIKKKKNLTRVKSTQVVELPEKDDRKKEGNLIEKKLMRRTVQHWAVLGPDMLYLAKSSSETHSELKIRLHSATVSAQKNTREFMIKKQGKSYLLRAESDEDCQSWIEIIQQCIAAVTEQDCEIVSDEEENVPPVSPAIDSASDKISPGPDDVYENEDEAPKLDGNDVVDGGDTDDVYDDVEAPPIASPATLEPEPDLTESVSPAASTTTSSSSNYKRISIFGGSGKNKDAMPSDSKLSGFVQKKGKFSWDKKWLVLSDQTLYYANSEADKKYQGTLSLVGASIDTKSSTESRPHVINIKYKTSKMQLSWDDSQVYDDWLRAIKSAAGDDQSSEPTVSEPTTSEKDLKVDENGVGDEEEAEEYENPDVKLAADAEENGGDDVYDDVVAEPQVSSSVPKPTAPVQQKQPPVKKPIQGGGKSELKDPEHSGYLNRKTTGIIKKWERKWLFIVDKTLYMSATEEDESYKNLLALANVSEVLKGSVDKYPHGITLQLKPSCGKDIILAADTKEEQSVWVSKLNEECDVFNCELSSDEEDTPGAYLHKAAAPEPPASQVPQEEDSVRVDDQGFIMEDIYEDVSQPLEPPPKAAPPKEPAKVNASAPSLPPRNPNLKPTPVVNVANAPSLPPRNQPTTPTVKSASAEPEPIMEEFYEDMEELKAEYENTKNIMDQKANSVEEPPITENEPPTAKKDLPLPKVDAEKKSPLLKKKELKKEKEQQKKEAKKKEKESKKLKKEKAKEGKERTKSVSKPKSKAAELKDADKPRSNSVPTITSQPPVEDDEEYVIEELTAQDEKPSVDEPEPIDEEIYEDVEEPPIPSPRTKTSKKDTPRPTISPASSKDSLPRSSVMSPPGNVSDFKKSASPVAEPPRSHSVSPSNVKIRTSGITVSSISKPKPPASVTPVDKTTPTTSSTATTTTTTDTKSTKAPITTTASVKTAVTKTTNPLNRPRVRVSEAIYKFQKRDSTVDGILHKGMLFHKSPGRTKFREEYCEVSGVILNFYREQGDEKPFTHLSLDECELRVVKEQYDGRRHVFCLAAGSASDMLSTELNADLQKWLSVLEPLVKKYVKEE